VVSIKRFCYNYNYFYFLKNMPEQPSNFCPEHKVPSYLCPNDCAYVHGLKESREDYEKKEMDLVKARARPIGRVKRLFMGAEKKQLMDKERLLMNKERLMSGIEIDANFENSIRDNEKSEDKIKKEMAEKEKAMEEKAQKEVAKRDAKKAEEKERETQALSIRRARFAERDRLEAENLTMRAKEAAAQEKVNATDYSQLETATLNTEHRSGLESDLRFHEELLQNKEWEIKAYIKLSKEEGMADVVAGKKEEMKQTFKEYYKFFTIIEAIKNLLEKGAVSKSEFVPHVMDTTQALWRELYKDPADEFMPENELQEKAADAFKHAAIINDGGGFAYAY